MPKSWPVGWLIPFQLPKSCVFLCSNNQPMHKRHVNSYNMSRLVVHQALKFAYPSGDDSKFEGQNTRKSCKFPIGLLWRRNPWSDHREVWSVARSHRRRHYCTVSQLIGLDRSRGLQLADSWKTPPPTDFQMDREVKRLATYMCKQIMAASDFTDSIQSQQLLVDFLSHCCGCSRGSKYEDESSSWIQNVTLNLQ